MYVKMVLEIPTKLSAEEKKLLKKLDEAMKKESNGESYTKHKKFSDAMRDLFS
jgi:DnaJ-class molecular chaperone